MLGQAYSKHASLHSLPDAEPPQSLVDLQPPQATITTTCLKHCTANHSSAGTPPSTTQTGDQKKTNASPFMMPQRRIYSSVTAKQEPVDKARADLSQTQLAPPLLPPTDSGNKATT
jgi:hypothetical protein